MSKIILPIVADAVINGRRYENLEVVTLNKKSVWIKLPDGHIIKRNPFRHKITLKSVLLTGGER